ncbi:3-hydroxyacyl-CoA dehydrogenase [Rhodoligotrophos defluvii]|uniref:3-hydroxyacyl-CoA dehydrogenase n=1 Tax=Rhodoligotrophos defluvii TaxID=2561934 RepID=UPI0010C96CD1|nr:3-hydroxyacyl-CoA dehydrogenase [Rhodoligotrophos defluvii]
MARAESVVGVVGAGTMGRGIAQVLAEAGVQVLLHDASEAAAHAGRGFACDMIERAVQKGRMDASAGKAAKARIVPALSLDRLGQAEIIIEAIVEDLSAKRELIARLDPILDPAAIIASNTSSLSITAIAAGSAHPERVAGLHFFNPVPLMKVVEVIRGVETAEQVIERLIGLVESFGHFPVVTDDSPGFVVNHAGRGLYTEGLRVVQEGVTDPATVDLLMREAAGFRMGPFELLDLTGLDVSYTVMRKIYDQFWQEPRFRPTPLPERQVQAGHFGRKTGRGFYRYRDGAMERPAEIAPPALAGSAARIWLDRSTISDQAFLSALAARLADWHDDGMAPAEESICLVAPIGLDATQAALSAGTDPARTVAVDPLFGPDRRLTLMTSPAMQRAFRDAAWAVLSASGAKVSVVRDSPGFVVQRVVATIINIACDIAQQLIASPGDIDKAVRLGLGYPAGPLSLGDTLGPARILAILDGLLARTGDPRYRASLWLRRRAELGLSLLSSEVSLS